MATGIGAALKKLMLARIVADGGDFAARTVFTEEDIAAAATEGIERRQCLDWVRHTNEKYVDGDDRKVYFSMNELSEEEVRKQLLILAICTLLLFEKTNVNTFF